LPPKADPVAGATATMAQPELPPPEFAVRLIATV
jgi:hypothetical protein